MTALVRALLEHLPQDSAPVVAIVKPDLMPTPATKINGQKSNNAANYNPAMIYILELASIIVIQNHESAVSVGKEVVEALQDVIRNANTFHPLIVSRATLYLLHILRASHVR